MAIALLMFPQIAQTLYSPALADIGEVFAVGAQQAAQTLSVYFLAFAFGVVVWGRSCDRIGRRPSMLAGLALYAGASVLALNARTFDALLMAQALAAFGAAVGSVVTQTLLRDRFKGTELAQVFSIMGIALAASPAIGLFTGASLVHAFGYRGVLMPVAGVLDAVAVVPADLAGNPPAKGGDTAPVRDAVAHAARPRYLALDAAGGGVQYRAVQLLQSRPVHVPATGLECARVRLQRRDPGPGFRTRCLAQQAIAASRLERPTACSAGRGGDVVGRQWCVATGRKRFARVAYDTGGVGVRHGDPEHSGLGTGQLW
ncbi:MFS transporter [Pseudomonas sp. DR48]|nr:MFS transporter [Pseudomonas sp. DR48]